MLKGGQKMDPKVKILMLKGEKGDPGGSTWGNISGDLSSQTDLSTALSGKANTADLGAVCFTNDYEDLSNKPQFSEVAVSGSYTDLTNIPNFSTVATSGSYADLINTPTQLTDFSGVLPVNQGGTGATDGAIPRRFTLFSSVEGVEPTTITLSDSIQNYQKIGFVVSNPQVYGEISYNYSELAMLPNITTYRYTLRVFRLGETGPISCVNHFMEVNLSGSTLTYVAAYKFSISANSVDVYEQKLKIHYIFGYKY